MDFNSVENLAQNGFGGFVAVSELQASRCREVPEVKGIYLLFRSDTTPPKFSDRSIGGHFKGKDPTVPVATLQQEWVEGSRTVYIGKAGGRNSQATLKSRLRAYMDFGLGKPVGHWGGRYIWQLADSADLRVCWMATPNDEPASIESQMIQQFKIIYGKRPFANLRD